MSSMPLPISNPLPSHLPPLPISLPGVSQPPHSAASYIDSLPQCSHQYEQPRMNQTIGIASTPYLPSSGLLSPPLTGAPLASMASNPIPLPCITTTNPKNFITLGTSTTEKVSIPSPRSGPAANITLTASGPNPSASARRKRTHSETERRRRERVNARFNELRELVPACRGTQFARRGGEIGLHKLDILTEAVQYLRELEKQLQAAKRANAAKINFLVN